MKAGKITAKLRDAVPVRFMADGEEVKRYRNIDIPDSLKELEMRDFQFDVPVDEKISFQLFFDEGILPELWPEPRAKMTRTEKAVAKATAAAEPTEEIPEAPAVIVNIDAAISVDEVKSAASDSMEIAYNATGGRRTAIGEIVGEKPAYKGAPSYAYAIGNYLVDRYGTLTGESKQELINALVEQGFIAE